MYSFRIERIHPQTPEEKFWEGFRFPSQTLLKTTKGGLGPLWKPLFGDGRGCFLRWDGGRERRRSKAGRVRSFRAFCLVGDEVGEGVVVLAPGLGGRGPCRGRGRHAEVVVPYGWVRRAPSTTPASRRIAERLRRRGRGTGWESARGASPKGIAATSAGGALSEAGTFASAASGGKSEQKGVAAVKIL